MNAGDNQVPAAWKHSDDSTLAYDNNDTLSSKNSSINNKSLSDDSNYQVEGVNLHSSTKFEGVHTIEGEREIMNVDIEGEHNDNNPIVEGEKDENNTNVSNDQNDKFLDINYHLSNEGEGSEIEEMLKDAPLDFDPSFPPMDKWT